MTLEEFIDRVTHDVQERTGMESVCINNIALFYPDGLDEAVEYCSMLTTGEFWEYWDEEEEEGITGEVVLKCL